MVGNFHLMETQLEKKAESIVLIDTHTRQTNSHLLCGSYISENTVCMGVSPLERGHTEPSRVEVKSEGKASRTGQQCLGKSGCNKQPAVRVYSWQGS